MRYSDDDRYETLFEGDEDKDDNVTGHYQYAESDQDTLDGYGSGYGSDISGIEDNAAGSDYESGYVYGDEDLDYEDKEQFLDLKDEMIIVDKMSLGLGPTVAPPPPLFFFYCSVPMYH
jgi:hypothetical protein